MSSDPQTRERVEAIRPEQLFGAAITRRGFMKRGLVGTVALGGAGLLPAGCAKYPAAPPGLRVLDNKEYTIVNAAAVVYVGADPASEGLDVAAFFDGLLSRQPEWAQKQVKPAKDVARESQSAAPEEPRVVAILKSGMIDGMAYTLYADGSIEAVLATGTVRFASIDALRFHLEQNS